MAAGRGGGPGGERHRQGEGQAGIRASTSRRRYRNAEGCKVWVQSARCEIGGGQGGMWTTLRVGIQPEQADERVGGATKGRTGRVIRCGLGQTKLPAPQSGSLEETMACSFGEVPRAVGEALCDHIGEAVAATKQRTPQATKSAPSRRKRHRSAQQAERAAGGAAKCYSKRHQKPGRRVPRVTIRTTVAETRPRARTMSSAAAALVAGHHEVSVSPSRARSVVVSPVEECPEKDIIASLIAQCFAAASTSPQ